MRQLQSIKQRMTRPPLWIFLVESRQNKWSMSLSFAVLFILSSQGDIFKQKKKELIGDLVRFFSSLSLFSLVLLVVLCLRCEKNFVLVACFAQHGSPFRFLRCSFRSIAYISLCFNVRVNIAQAFYLLVVTHTHTHTHTHRDTRAHTQWYQPVHWKPRRQERRRTFVFFVFQWYPSARMVILTSLWFSFLVDFLSFFRSFFLAVCVFCYLNKAIIIFVSMSITSVLCTRAINDQEKQCIHLTCFNYDHTRLCPGRTLSPLNNNVLRME